MTLMMSAASVHDVIINVWSDYCEIWPVTEYKSHWIYWFTSKSNTGNVTL